MERGRGRLLSEPLRRRRTFWCPSRPLDRLGGRHHFTLVRQNAIAGSATAPDRRNTSITPIFAQKTKLRTVFPWSTTLEDPQGHGRACLGLATTASNSRSRSLSTVTRVIKFSGLAKPVRAEQRAPGQSHELLEATQHDQARFDHIRSGKSLRARGRRRSFNLILPVSYPDGYYASHLQPIVS
jgi:hypothetical protein